MTLLIDSFPGSKSAAVRLQSSTASTAFSTSPLVLFGFRLQLQLLPDPRWEIVLQPNQMSRDGGSPGLALSCRRPATKIARWHPLRSSAARSRLRTAQELSALITEINRFVDLIIDWLKMSTNAALCMQPTILQHADSRRSCSPKPLTH